MKKIDSYTIASGKDIAELHQKVHDFMKNGRDYQPYGSGYFDGTNYCQPIVTYEKRNWRPIIKKIFILNLIICALFWWGRFVLFLFK